MEVMISGSCVFNRKTCLCRSGRKKFPMLDGGKIVDSIVDCIGYQGGGSGVSF